MLRIPVIPDNPAYAYDILIEGVTYRFAYTWNERSKAWYLDIGTSTGFQIVTGIKIVTDWALTHGRHRDQRLPPGMLAAMSLDPNNNSPPGFEDLGRRVRIVYYTEADVAIIRATSTSPTPGSWEDIFGPDGPVVT